MVACKDCYHPTSRTAKRADYFELFILTVYACEAAWKEEDKWDTRNLYGTDKT